MSIVTWQAASSQSPKGRYQNQEVDYRTEWGNLVDITKAYVKTKRAEATPARELPLRRIPESELSDPKPGARVYRLGHSSVLIRLDGRWLLTDPVFSDRASPVQWMGPKRFHPVPLDLSDLPEIDLVVISHDHYDHLDRATIEQLIPRVKRFVTPLGVGQYLCDWGVAPERITELDWWQGTSDNTLRLTATPAQHFSGRGLMDRDRTLWSSWVIEGNGGRIFFSGDSGYFGGFKAIGEQFGPFDLTLIETGAYNPLWQAIHMLPEQSLQAHLDLKGKVMLPIHNSTFDLALHDWHEPLERITEAARAEQVELAIPRIGEALELGQPVSVRAWWRGAPVQAEERGRQTVLAAASR